MNQCKIHYKKAEISVFPFVLTPLTMNLLLTPQLRLHRPVCVCVYVYTYIHTYSIYKYTHKFHTRTNLFIEYAYNLNGGCPPYFHVKRFEAYDV